MPVDPDARVYVIALALALVSGFLFGIVPVRQVLRTDPWLGVTLGLPLGKWCGTSLVGPQGFFQLLSEPLVLCQRALQLPFQRLDSLFEFLLPVRGATAVGRALLAALRDEES